MSRPWLGGVCGSQLAAGSEGPWAIAWTHRDIEGGPDLEEDVGSAPGAGSTAGRGSDLVGAPPAAP